MGAQLGDSFEKIGTMCVEGAKVESQTLNNEVSSNRTKSMVLNLIVIAVALILGYRLARQVSVRLENIAAAAKEIAGGELTKPVLILSQDEIGQVAASLEDLRQHTHQSMAEIHMAADQVAAGARNVSDASVSRSQGAAEQASSVEELSSSISEISSQTASNAENANKANELTERARQQAQVGATASLLQRITAS